MPKLSAPRVSDRRRHDFGPPPVTLPKLKCLERPAGEYPPHPDSDPMPAHVLMAGPPKTNGHAPAHRHCFVAKEQIRLVMPPANRYGTYLLQPYEAQPGEAADFIKEAGDWIELSADSLLLPWAIANTPRRLRRPSIWEQFEHQHKRT